MRYFDAHVHLHEACLAATVAAMGDGTEAYTVVANGTGPDDWASVEALESRGSLRVLKAYGVHPWKVDSLPGDWESALSERLGSGAASVGEIGLDHWIEPRCPALQRDVFERQLHLAEVFRLVPTVHAVRAAEEVEQVLRRMPPGRGFLMHAFAGSRQVQRRLLDIGGHFSFSAYAAEPSRKRMREAIAYCPADRLLTETDAPSMAPPEWSRDYPLGDAEDRPVHDPREIRTALHVLAAIRGEDPEHLGQAVEVTFGRLFLPSG